MHPIDSEGISTDAQVKGVEKNWFFQEEPQHFLRNPLSLKCYTFCELVFFSLDTSHNKSFGWHIVNYLSQ